MPDGDGRVSDLRDGMTTSNVTRSDTSKCVDLVCEGGGVRGIALVGALAVLEEHGYKPQNLAGTSAGAIVTTLSAAGYSAQDLRTIIGGQHFSTFMDLDWVDRIPLFGPPLSVLQNLGVYEGKVLYDLIKSLLEAKGVRTFGDLRVQYNADSPDKDDPRYRYKVQVIASDISARQLLILPYHAQKLGVDPDELEVALAVRMSMSIPVFFEPVRVRNPLKPHDEHVIVDGGLLSNYPIWFFDAKGTPAWPTFGLRLVEGDPRTTLAERLPTTDGIHGGIPGVVHYAIALIHTMTAALDRLYIETDDFVRTIPIPTLGVPSTDFTLSPDQTQALYDSGRQAADAFLKTWDFERYRAVYRSGQPVPTRREQALSIGDAAHDRPDSEVATPVGAGTTRTG